MRKPKKKKTLWDKLRPAIRNIYRFSDSRKEAIKAATYKGEYGQMFKCPTCIKEWPIQMADVDHNPRLGDFDSWPTFFDWCKRCFEGPVQVLCKICHRKKTTSEMKRKPK